MRTCFLYARVSTGEQDTGAQLLALTKAASKFPDHQRRIYEDKGSGGIPWRERGLAQLLDEAKPDDIIIAPEISRIGRSTADVLDFLANVAKKGVTLIIDKSGLTIDGSIQSKIISTVMALAAEIERDFIRSRTREGLAQARAKGKQLGRPKGHAKTHPCDGHAESIAHLRAAKIPNTNIAKLTGFSTRQLTTHAERVRLGIINPSAPPQPRRYNT